MTDPRLLSHLAEQVHFLHTSCMAFDQGSTLEAKRLSLHLRILFHQTSQSSALLGQLGLLPDILMYDAAIRPHRGDGLSPSDYGLVYMAVGQNRFVPHLDEVIGGEPAWVSFEDWWTATVLQDQTGYMLTREALVLAMAHEDGGAHVGEDLSAAYQRLRAGSNWGGAGRDGKWVPAGTPVFASVRQIAHEALVSLAHTDVRAFPDSVPRRRYAHLPGPALTTVYGTDTLMGGSIIHGVTMDGEPIRNENTHDWPTAVGRNDDCPCGSGLKYKKCHGS